ncbi:MAG: carboxypeptidase regulatory-like domain-containing protein [Acidobacteria bacterium]|nr:carboxypeptidase regulatory-like domain-containing protein [Acidobacteriota bacterium]
MRITATDVSTGIKRKVATNEDGYYTVGLLEVGTYELLVEMEGFKQIVRSGIKLSIGEVARIDFVLELGEITQRVEVTEDASPLNFENAELKQAITTDTVRELPLILGGRPRTAIAFVTLLPGVTTGAGSNTYQTQINGGINEGDEALVDGISIQDGLNTETGAALSSGNNPISVEAISEISVLTSNAEPHYGSTLSGVVTSSTKSGTNAFHGSLFEYLRNTVLNARQFGVPTRPKNNQNAFGGTIGGPIKLPGVWSAKRKSYFFLAHERFRIRGGATVPILSIPSLKQRSGDFSDWVDSAGRLIPVFDPATTRPNPNFAPNLPTGATNLPFLRDQFMGCDGNSPNVICQSDPRLQNSLAKKWFQFLPNPTFGGPLNNYVAPFARDTQLFNQSNLWDVRIDHHFGDKDHFFGTYHSRRSVPSLTTFLPPQLATERPYQKNWSILPRLSWDHTFSPTLLNHAAIGYNDTFVESECLDKEFAGILPQIPGVADHNNPPVINLAEFSGWGCNSELRGSRPTYIVNDLLTKVRGSHTFKFGGEYRKLGINQVNRDNGSGAFAFSRLNTGLLGITSGSSVASFILGRVASGSGQFRTVEDFYGRADAWSLHFGDTWRATPKLSVNWGLRWDVSRPSVEKYDRLSFFDFGPNPRAGNRPGRLAFAGDNYGAASFGDRHPEKTWYKGLAPRLGLAYRLTPATAVRAGYAMIIQQAYYPGWNGGIALDGFNSGHSVSSSQGGLEPAFLLSQGLPQNFVRPPFIDSSYRNGQGLNYRPFDANRLPYSQQWNLTIEHQFTNSFYVSAAYVANKGTRLPSRVAPLNALDPKYLAMGQQLYDQFQPGQTHLHGVPLPYEGWVQQMTGCAPSVAQALLPYPQYCSALAGQNENAGNSSYHSLQLKAEHRFSKGMWVLASYTLGKILNDNHNTQPDAGAWSGANGAISPFERQRNKSLSITDVPQTLSVAMTYELPFGKAKRFINSAGAADRLISGWELSSVVRATSGIPFVIRNFAGCNVPAQFRAGCIPAILPGANPFAQKTDSSFDPNKPLFNKSAFESADSFNFYWGKGPRVSNLRGFGYHNVDLNLIKNTRITENVNLQFRAEFFNLFNWHILTGPYYSAFNEDVSSPRFGMWNGTVSAPRNIQFGMKLQF